MQRPPSDALASTASTSFFGTSDIVTSSELVLGEKVRSPEWRNNARQCT
jgi:hypothetical protein